jgi:hypothetical protein
MCVCVCVCVCVWVAQLHVTGLMNSPVLICEYHACFGTGGANDYPLPQRALQLHLITQHVFWCHSQGWHKFSLTIIFTLFFLLLPLWSIGHPSNSLFHFSSLTPRQSVGLFRRGISPLQGRYLHIHRINADRDPSLEWDSNPWSQCSCLRARGHCDRQFILLQCQQIRVILRRYQVQSIFIEFI